MSEKAEALDDPSLEQIRTDRGNPVWRLLKTYCEPYLPYFGYSIVAKLVSQALWLYPPIVVGIAFDAIFIGDQPFQLPFIPSSWLPESQMGQFWASLGLLAFCYVGASILYTSAIWVRDVAAYRLQNDLRIDAYAAMQQLHFGFFDEYRTGELMSILNNDVNQLEGFFTGSFTQIVNAIFIFGVATSYMVFLNWQLALLAFVIPVTNAAFNYWYSHFVEPKHQQRREQVGGINSRIENNIAGMGLIKIYNRERAERDRVAEESELYKDVSWQIARVRTLVNRITGWLPNAGYMLLFCVGGYWVLQGPPPFFSGSLAAGTLLSFLIYNNRLSWPLKQVTDIVDTYQTVKASSGRVLGLFDEPPTITENDHAIELTSVDGNVEFDDITFAYPGSDEPTISGVSFEADSGEMVGLVGSTGAGKTTLMKLLPRFYDVDGGAIRIDGHDIRDVSLESLRRNIGYVGQDPYLFDGTIRENIAYSQPGAADEAVEEAARRAGATEFITDLPDGYDTQVGERGKKLSGGQRQRISIARAILNDPAILILDEATSHVDNETEAFIQANLEQLIADRTTFAIAHRLSTVRSADKILVLDDGTVTERGKHDELLARDGTYADLWKVQVGEVNSLPQEFLSR